MSFGDYARAAEIFEQSLSIMRRWKPEEHRDVALGE